MDPKRVPCAATTKDGKPCQWKRLTGSEFCHNHSPDTAEKRRRSGGIRHPRMSKAISLGGAEYDPAKLPPIHRILDRLLDIDQELDDIVNATTKAVAEKLLDPETTALEAKILLESKRALLGVIATAYGKRITALAEVRRGLFDEREHEEKKDPKPGNRSTRDGTPSTEHLSSPEAVSPWLEPN